MKTPSVNVKDLLRKLSFLKNNLSLLVPILITMVALLLFIPTRILSGKLRRTVEKTSVQTGKTITSLIGRVEKAAQAKQLEPYVTAYAHDANEIENLMKQTTERELLSYKIFPDTNERTTLLFEEFARRYCTGLETTLHSIGAGVPPTDSEVMAAMERAPQSPYGIGYGRGGMRPTPMTTSPTGGRVRGISSYMMTDTQRKIFDTICLEKAQAAHVYATAADLAGYIYWTDWKFENRDAAYRDCWYWQLGYWIIEDVVTTIRQMNEGTASIVDAPVKRLMNVSFVLGRTTGRAVRRPGMQRGIRRSTKEGDNPAYVVDVKKAMTTPCTGRVCNDEIDVVHFDVRVIVGAKDVMAFMKALCSAKEHRFSGWKGKEPVQTFQHNQITILESSTAPVDRKDPDHDPYRYGDEPVVDLDLICEYILNKAAYEHMKPQQVKDDIVSASDTSKNKR